MICDFTNEMHYSEKNKYYLKKKCWWIKKILNIYIIDANKYNIIYKNILYIFGGV
jgi:hypothetical protein